MVYRIISAHILFLISFFTLDFSFCKNKAEQETTQNSAQAQDTFEYETERFADIRILRYKVPGFEELSLKEKELLYYLYEAALAGRDIFWDQNYKYNLSIRHTLEGIINSYKGNRSINDYKKFITYVKRVWFSNGIHHHYSNDKIIPEFSQDYFIHLINNSDPNLFPLSDTRSLVDFTRKLIPLIFDPQIASKKVNLNPNTDVIANSATNFYENVTQAEVETFYKTKIQPNDKIPVSYGLNSKLIKENGEVKERIWRIGGMYTQSIEEIVYWLEKASSVAENETQKKAIDKLIKYYKTGNLRDFDDYNIAWIEDTNSRVDVVNGFIELYGDPLGYKGSFESVVSIKDMEATKRIESLGKEAQWFEDNSPIILEHKKRAVQGISAKVITVVVQSGDASPPSAIGINLPNSEWIRETYGSKSVNLGNIVEANDKARSVEVFNEFSYTEKETELALKHAAYADKLFTDMHEVIGHASGQINKGVGSSIETLKSYASALEEARADLVALYYLMDKKLVDLGLMESLEVGKAAYDDYIREGLLLQLNKIELGKELEESHMRNRQLIAKWAFEKGLKDNIIEKKRKENKIFFVINDYDKLRDLFGQLLREVQRIKSEGDYEAGKNLVENYGVKIDPEIHKEVLERYEKLNVPPYSGFINPKLTAIKEDGKIVDVKIEYPSDFLQQMLHYGEKYSFLPLIN